MISSLISVKKIYRLTNVVVVVVVLLYPDFKRMKSFCSIVQDWNTLEKQKEKLTAVQFKFWRLFMFH